MAASMPGRSTPESETRPRTPHRLRAPNGAAPPIAGASGWSSPACRGQSTTSSSASFFLGSLDEFRNAIEFFVRKLRAFAAQDGRNHLLGRAVEKRVDKMSQSRLAGCASGRGRYIDVLRALLFVRHMPFFL